MSRLRDREDHSSRIIVRQRVQQEDAVVTSEGKDYVLYLKTGSIALGVQIRLELALSNLRAYPAMTEEQWDVLEAEVEAARAELRGEQV